MLLSSEELKTIYYPTSSAMSESDVRTYLLRANAFAEGVIGGRPAVVNETIKAAVGLAFEIFAKAETDQVNDVTGNITQAAPEGAFVRNKKTDPLDTVRDMLAGAKRSFNVANTKVSERGVSFL